MNDAPKPPLLNPPRNLRHALTLNLFLPGSGQLYLGQTLLGIVFGVSFAGCFVAVLALFIHGYRHYLQLTTDGDILGGNNLEQLARDFPVVWFMVLLVLAILIHIASLVCISFSPKSRGGP